MLVDFNYPFMLQSDAVHGLTKNTSTIFVYNAGTNYGGSSMYDFTRELPSNELRCIDITVDMKTMYNSTSTSYYRMVIPYSSGSSKYYAAYWNQYACSVTKINTETIGSTTVYTMRVRFRCFNTTYTTTYNLSGIRFYAYQGYCSEINGCPGYNNAGSPIDHEIVSVDNLIITKNLTATTLSVFDEYKTGIYPYIKIASRAPSDIRLPVSVKVNKDGTILDSSTVLVNNGTNTDIVTNYCEDAIVENVLPSTTSEDFKLYSFTAFKDNLTIDYPVPDYYEHKPILKVFCPGTQNISFGNPAVSTAYLKRAIPAITRYDGKSLKLDLKLTVGTTYYVLVATGPKSYFKNTSRHYPGSLYIYYDENATYSHTLGTDYGASRTNSIEIEAGKTYSLIDNLYAYSVSSGFVQYYKFIPKVSGVYNIKLSNIWCASGVYNNSNNQMRIYQYNSAGTQTTYYGYYYTENSIISNTTHLNLTAGSTYYFAVYFRYGSYYCRNVDFEIDLVTQGTSVTTAVNIGAVPIDMPFILTTNSSEYGNLYYDYDTSLYFKMYLYKGIKYSFAALSGQGRAITAYLLSEDGNTTYATLSSTTATFNSTYTCTNSGWYVLRLKNYSSTYTGGDGYCQISMIGVLEGDSGYGRSMDNPVVLGNIAVGTSTYNSRDISSGLLYGKRQTDDVLWFELDCVSGDSYQIRSTSHNGDNYVYVYNSSGSLIGYNDDSGGSYNFSYTFTASYTGKHYFYIGYYGTTSVTGYCTFTITRTDN